MNKKQALQQLLKEEQMSTLDKKHIALLEKTILSTIQRNRSSYSFFAYLRTLKYFVIPTVSLAVIVVLVLSFLHGGKQQSQNGRLPQHNFIQQVSAEGLLRAMQVSTNSERLHVIMQTSSNGPDNSNEAEDSGNYSETWIDRKNHLSRLERKDSQNRLRALIIKQGLPSENGKTYQFILAGMHSYPLDLSTKKGLFVSRTDHDGYENILDLTLRKDYVETLKQNGVQVKSSYEKTTYEGHPAYKLTLIRPEGKRGIIYTEILTIDKNTQLPYEDVTIDPGRNDIPGGILQMTTKYSFSTNFSNTVFDRKPPKGYSLIENPKIANFSLEIAGGTNSNESQEELWKDERELYAEVAGDGQTLGIGEGMFPDGYKYNVFISDKSFSSKEEAQNTKNVAFTEIQSHEVVHKQNNISTQVYSLPNIPQNDFSQYGIFKLEVMDTSGKKLYEVKQVMQYKSLLTPFGYLR